MNIWKTLYAIFVPLTLYGGYMGLRPEHTADTNADWILVAVAFFMFSLFPLGAVAFGFAYSKKEYFERPSYDRSPFRWWTDTLQPLRITFVYLALDLIGSACALPYTDQKGTMIS